MGVLLIKSLYSWVCELNFPIPSGTQRTHDLTRIWIFQTHLTPVSWKAASSDARVVLALFWCSWQEASLQSWCSSPFSTSSNKPSWVLRSFWGAISSALQAKRPNRSEPPELQWQRKVKVVQATHQTHQSYVKGQCPPSSETQSNYIVDYCSSCSTWELGCCGSKHHWRWILWTCWGTSS